MIIGKVLADLGQEGGRLDQIYDTQVEVIGIFEVTSVFENGSIATLLSDIQISWIARTE